jgi:choline-glycine betaine transporter
MAGVTTAVAMALVGLCFVTSADSASPVPASLSSRGALRPHRNLVVLWGAPIGCIAAVLLPAGGLGALPQATILVALPFAVVMLTLAATLPREAADGGPGHTASMRRSRPPAIKRRPEATDAAEKNRVGHSRHGWTDQVDACGGEHRVEGPANFGSR